VALLGLVAPIIAKSFIFARISFSISKFSSYKIKAYGFFQQSRAQLSRLLEE
jgi:hypothetical protein